MHRVWVGAEIIEESGRVWDAVFSISDSDETLIAMLDARRKAYYDQRTGLANLDPIG